MASPGASGVMLKCFLERESSVQFVAFVIHVVQDQVASAGLQTWVRQKY